MAKLGVVDGACYRASVSTERPCSTRVTGLDGLDGLDGPRARRRLSRSTPLQVRLRAFLTDSRKLGHTLAVRTALDAAPLLRGTALRVTRARVAVLTAVHRRPHADPDSSIRIVRRDLREVSTQTVYDVLRPLTAAGLVRGVEPPGSVARYESRVGDNHWSWEDSSS